MKKHTISACLIVCNEAPCLAKCLDSIFNFVDQIVIIDTGSTDNTVNIAQRYGAVIDYFTWNNDFSAARNYALSLALGDWILVIDADEQLANGDMLIPTLTQKSYDGYYVTIDSKTNDGQMTYEDYVVRLFRNDPRFRFTGAIHEQVVSSIKHHKGKTAVAFSPLVLLHDGYLPSEKCRKQKNERNRSIITDQLGKNDHDPFLLYSLGIELVQANQLVEAAQVLRQALNKFKGNEGYFRDYLLLTLITNIKIALYQESESIFKGALALLPNDADILFLESIRQANLQNYRQAWRQLNAGGLQTNLVTKALVMSVAGELLKFQSLPTAAFRYFQQSMQEQPTIFAAIRLIEFARHNNLDLKTVLANDTCSYLQLVQEAQAINDYPLAALLLLTDIFTDRPTSNLVNTPAIYLETIEQADLATADRALLQIMALQITVYEQLSTYNLLKPSLNMERQSIIQTSVKLWLRLWPKHHFSTKIWECCL